MRPVWNLDPEFQSLLKQWVESRIWDDGTTLPVSQMLAVVEDGEIQAGVAFHDWNPRAGVIEISAASRNKRWLTRSVLKAIFSYVFEDIGCQLCAARVDPENTSLRRIFRSYGFNEFLIPRLLGRSKDQVVLTLTDDDWRSNKFNRKAS